MPVAFKYIYIAILLLGVGLFVLGLAVDSYGIISFIFAPGLIIIGVLIAAAIQAIFFGFPTNQSVSKPHHSKWLAVLAIVTIAIFAGVLATG